MGNASNVGLDFDDDQRNVIGRLYSLLKLP
jgi:hypothetical protein